MRVRALVREFGALERIAVVGSALSLTVGCRSDDARLAALESRTAAMEKRLVAAEGQAAAAASAASSIATIASAAGLTGKCPAAKRQCRAAWSVVWPPARKAQVETEAALQQQKADWSESRRSGYPWDEERRRNAWSAFAVSVKPALDACSSGAARIRETAEAVKPPPSDTAGIGLVDLHKAAVASALSAYDACKDSDP